MNTCSRLYFRSSCHPTPKQTLVSSWQYQGGLLNFLFSVSASLLCTPHILGFLQLLHALNSIRLVFCSPLGHFTVGLGQGTLQLPLGFLLLLILFPEQVTVMASRLQGVGQGILGLGREWDWDNEW